MKRVSIYSVSFANSYPLNWGIMNGETSKYSDLRLTHPSAIPQAVRSGRAFAGLLPIAAIPGLPTYHIFGEHCIGSYGKVRTVTLFSALPADKIERIYLDYRSVTSVRLIKVIAKHHWKRKYEWMNTEPGFNPLDISDRDGVLIIGDSCFSMEGKFQYSYDLGEEWTDLTGLPFIYACWVSAERPEKQFIKEFINDIARGIENSEQAVSELNNLPGVSDSEVTRYIRENIDYSLDSIKMEAMKLFFDYLGRL